MQGRLGAQGCGAAPSTLLTWPGTRPGEQQLSLSVEPGQQSKGMSLTVRGMPGLPPLRSGGS